MLHTCTTVLEWNGILTSITITTTTIKICTCYYFRFNYRLINDIFFCLLLLINFTYITYPIKTIFFDFIFNITIRFQLANKKFLYKKKPNEYFVIYYIWISICLFVWFVVVCLSIFISCLCFCMYISELCRQYIFFCWILAY